MRRAFVFVSLMCSGTGAPGVARLERGESGCVLIAASKQRPGSVPPERTPEEIRTGLSMAPDYPGCPHCGASSVVRCSRCRQLGCWNPSSELYRCPRCGNAGRVSGTIESVSELGTA